MSEPPITLADIEATRDAVAPWVIETPVVRWGGREMAERVGADTEVWLKLELMQVAGSFKPRGSLNNLLGLDEAARKRGVTAVSAGNHAIAVAFAARELGSTAKVVMPATANPYRVARCRELGAEVVLMDDVGKAFDEVKRIETEEGRTFVHQRGADRDDQGVEDEALGARNVSATQRPRHGRGDRTAHGAGRQHLGQHDERKDERQARQRADTHLTGEVAFRDAGGRHDDHGDHVRCGEARQGRPDRTFQKRLGLCGARGGPLLGAAR